MIPSGSSVNSDGKFGNWTSSWYFCWGLGGALGFRFMPTPAMVFMSTNTEPSRGPGHCLPVRMHIWHWGSVASHLMRFLRQMAQALVRGGILCEVSLGICRVGVWRWDGKAAQRQYFGGQGFMRGVLETGSEGSRDLNYEKRRMRAGFMMWRGRDVGVRYRRSGAEGRWTGQGHDKSGLGPT